MTRTACALLAAALTGALSGAALPGAALADGALTDGAGLFAETCAACHGAAGIGNPGLAPPLDLAPFWAGLGDRAPEYLAGVIAAGLTGRITAGGIDYIGLAMPPQPGLDDAEAAEVATYVLATLGGAALAVTPAEIAAARAAAPSHAELRQLRKGG